MTDQHGVQDTLRRVKALQADEQGVRTRVALVSRPGDHLGLLAYERPDGLLSDPAAQGGQDGRVAGFSFDVVAEFDRLGQVVAGRKTGVGAQLVVR
jgi:hypothetical protein